MIEKQGKREIRSESQLHLEVMESVLIGAQDNGTQIMRYVESVFHLLDPILLEDRVVDMKGDKER